MESLIGLLAAAHGSLLANGESFAFFGFAVGIPATYFGQKKFEPAGRNAQYGRWRAAHWVGKPVLLLGVLGLILIVAAKG
ncbi:MAG: hypothetical protein ACYCYQ_15485 [Acidimicrobiales bacterium]